MNKKLGCSVIMSTCPLALLSAISSFQMSSWLTKAIRPGTAAKKLRMQSIPAKKPAQRNPERAKRPGGNAARQGKGSRGSEFRQEGGIFGGDGRAKEIKKRAPCGALSECAKTRFIRWPNRERPRLPGVPAAWLRAWWRHRQRHGKDLLSGGRCPRHSARNRPDRH